MRRHATTLQSRLTRAANPSLHPHLAPLTVRPLLRSCAPSRRRYPNGMQHTNNALIWIDCEMTGLDETRDRILEIACYITDGSLAHVDSSGVHRVIRQTPATMAGMNDWCREVHGRSGLTARCLDAAVAVTEEQAAGEVVEYIRRYVPHPHTALIAGNSIHADRKFLAKEPWAGILEMLHYRIFDVSSLKEAASRWAPEEVLRDVPRKMTRHTAREDILESIAEARFYKDRVFGPRNGAAVRPDPVLVEGSKD